MRNDEVERLAIEAGFTPQECLSWDDEIRMLVKIVREMNFDARDGGSLALLDVPLTQQPLFVFAQEVLLGAWKDEELRDQALKAMRAQRNLILKAGASK